MPWGLHGGEALGIRPRRDSTPGRGGLLPLGLVRSLVVVLALERVEVALLGGAGVADRLDRLAFQGAVHALVRVVRLRVGRSHPLVV